MVSQFIVGFFLLALFASLLGLRYLLVDRYAEKQRLYPVYFVKLLPDDPTTDFSNDDDWPTELELPVAASTFHHTPILKRKERIGFLRVRYLNC